MYRRRTLIIWTSDLILGSISRLGVQWIQVHYLDALYIFLGIIEANWPLSLHWMMIVLLEEELDVQVQVFKL